MATRRGLGRCAAAFWLALLFSACGLALLLGGALGRAAFADLLLYGGGLCLLFGLGWAVLWRVGNVEVPPAELQDDVGLGGARADPRQQRLVRLLRSLGRRVSSALSRSAGTPSALALEMQ
ncbi:hypothetical protein lerEdw1_014094 [Lerista edwardsae]|nr:hypothetical protein lerEdw1_014096 [Lerista edwardsae]KAJ6634274.1 hypothetical protein lerEdw1_014094 [Lerista edwardsae]